MTISLPDKSDLIVANLKFAGFYRVNYDQSNWNKLIEQLKTDYEKIDEISRAQLLDDSFNLGRAQLVDQTVFLSMASYLKNENMPIPFQSAFFGLEFLADMLSSDSTAYDLLKDFYVKLVEKQYTKLGNQ